MNKRDELKVRIAEHVDILTALYRYSREVSQADSSGQTALILIRSIFDFIDCDRIILAVKGADAAEWTIYHTGLPASTASEDIESFRELLVISAGAEGGDKSLADTAGVQLIEVEGNKAESCEASFLAHPLLLDGHLTGMIRIGSAESDAFDTETARLLALISHEAAGVIGRLSLVEKERIAAKKEIETGRKLKNQMIRLGSLLQVSNRLLSTLDTGQILVRAMEGIGETIGAVKAAIMLLNHNQNEFRVETSIGLSEEECIDYRVYPGLDLAGQVAQRGEPFVAQNVDHDPVACIPILSMGEEIRHTKGLIVVFALREKRLLESDEVEILGILANQLYSALTNSKEFRNARLQMEEKSTRLSSLHELSQHIFEYAELLEKITDAAANLTEAAESCLMLLKDEMLVPATRKGFDELEAVKVDDIILAPVLKEGKSLISSSLESDSKLSGSNMKDCVNNSFIAVPLPGTGQEVAGVLMVHDKLTAKHFDSGDLQILQTLASQAATAIHTSILHRKAIENHQIWQEMKLARDIQAGLLPDKSPNFPGFDIASRYSPARSIGGDYFDFLELANGGLGIVIADVSGKGIPAALLMTMTRGALRSAVQECKSPSGALKRLNEILCSELDPYKFVTMIYMEVSPDGNICFANAGHELPLLITGNDNSVNVLEGSGFPLGFEVDSDWPEIRIKLNRGDSLFLFTDGLSEAGRGMPGSQGMFGVKRIRELLGQCKARTADEVLCCFDRALKDYSVKSEARPNKLPVDAEDFSSDIQYFKDDLTMISVLCSVQH